MKKLVFVLFGCSLLVLISFTNKSLSTPNSAEAVLAETIIGNWTYDGLIQNGKLISSNSCDSMDFLKFEPSGRYVSLQHISFINAISGEGTTTNCNPLKTNGTWSIAPNGTLTQNDKTVEIIEITETTLKLKSVITTVNSEGNTVKDIYIDCYKK